MKSFIGFFKNSWNRIKRYYTLKHNRPYRGKGTIEKAQAVEKSAKHSIQMLILGIFILIVIILVFDSLLHGVGVIDELKAWLGSFMKMKIPATDPRHPS